MVPTNYDIENQFIIKGRKNTSRMTYQIFQTLLLSKKLPMTPFQTKCAITSKPSSLSTLSSLNSHLTHSKRDLPSFLKSSKSFTKQFADDKSKFIYEVFKGAGTLNHLRYLQKKTNNKRLFPSLSFPLNNIYIYTISLSFYLIFNLK